MIVVIEPSFIFKHHVRISTDLQIQALWYATDRVAALPVQIWQELDTALQHNNKSIPTFKCSGIFKERKKLLLFLSRLQSYEQTITEKSPPLSIFPLPVFLYFFLISPLIPICFVFWSINLFLAFFLVVFPPFLCVDFLRYPLSFHLHHICYFECHFLFNPPLIPILCQYSLFGPFLFFFNIALKSFISIV